MSWRGRILFYTQLKQMVNTGMPLPQAIPLAAAVSQPYRSWSSQLADGCANGRALGELLSERGESPLICALVSAGEHSGRLPDLLQEIITISEHAIAMRRLVIGRAIYPMVLIHAALTIPMVPGWFLGHASGWTILIGPAILWGWIAVAGIVLWVTRRTGLAAHIALRQPLRALTSHLCTSATCLVLHAGAGAGMLWPKSLRMAADAAGNRVWGARLRLAADDIDQQKLPDLTSALRQCDYPQDVVNLIASGEQAGQTEDALLRAANLERERFQGRVEWTARIVMGIVYGLVVLFVAITIIRMFMTIYVTPVQDVMGDLP